MGFIANFPAQLLTEHNHWHMAHMNEHAPGTGVAFLDFHRKFLKEFHAWYDKSPGAKPALVAPWHSTPSPVAANLAPAAAKKWAGIGAAPAAFPSEDALGIAIHPLHDQVHGAIAATFGEPGMNDPATAPQYTEFWKLHGMIDHWLTVWQKAHPGK
jgi:hypothetical protein